MESSWSSLYFIELAIIYLFLSMNICLQTKFKHWNELVNFVAKFAPNFRARKHNWQLRNELGNCSLKSELKSTIMSCLFIKTTFSLEIIYSIITTYQIWLTGTSILTNENVSLCGQCVFRFLMCCRQSLLSPEGVEGLLAWV